MNGKVPTPVDGGDGHEGERDGVSGAPGNAPGEGVSGRDPSGETGGGGYPNPHDDKSGGLDHGGQSEMKYFGSGQAGGDGSTAPNAVAGSDDPDRDDEREAPLPAIEREPRSVHAGGRSFDVVEDSGVAAAEASGRVQNGPRDEPTDANKLAG